MKSFLLLLFVIWPTILFSQTRLAVWTFDGLAASPNTPISIVPTTNGDPQSLTAALYADGTNGSSIWKTSSSGNELTSQAGTTTNDPRTPASAGNALTLANSSANGKAIVIKFSMSGLRDPSMSLSIRSTSTGFSNHAWSWSTDGNTFTTFSSYTTNQTSAYYLQTLNLASVNELDDAALVYLKLTVSGATASNGNNRLDNIILSAIPPVPAAFAPDYPGVKAVTENRLDAVASLTTTGKVYFVLLPGGAVPPLPVQIKNQQDASGNPLTRAGEIVCATAYTEYQFYLDDLEPDTTYELFLVAENDDGLQSTPVKLEITTPPEGDHTPPVFKAGYPDAKTFGASVIIKIKLNEPGSAFVVALNAGDPPPSVVQIMEGQDERGGTTPNSHISVWTADTEYLSVFTRLQSSSEYDFYIVSQDTAANVSPISKLTVTAPPADQGGNGKLTVATYNLDFFASDVQDEQGREFGPVNDTLQAVNVAAVLKALGADVIGLQEISNEVALNSLVADLPGYDLIISGHWSHSWEAEDPHFPPQKTGLIYNTGVARLVDHEVMFADLYDQIQKGTSALPDYPGGDPTAFWSSGRLPLTARFDVTTDGISQRIRFIVIHSKSGSSPDDYSRRAYDNEHLFNYLATNYADEKIVLLGDFNDDVDQSIVPASISPYHDFVNDTSNYHVLTYDLSGSGASTFPALNSFIDHLIISSELAGAYVANSVNVIRPVEFIANYFQTTSDHFPVVARFAIKQDQAITFPALPSATYGDGPVLLKASATSKRPIVYSSSNPAVASVEENKLVILNAGTTQVIARQGGDGTYYPASAVAQEFVVEKASQLISWEPVSDKTFGDEPFEVNAASNSALVVTLSSRSSNIVVKSNQVTIVKPGRASIMASQSGNENYLSATVSVSFCVNPPAPTITADLSVPAVLSSSANSGNQWYLNRQPITDGTNTTIKATSSGVYQVRSTVDECTSAFSNEIALVVTEIKEQRPDGLQAFPNPVEDWVNVDGLPDDAGDIHVIDGLGHPVSVDLERFDNRCSIFVGNLVPGIYYVIVSNETVRQGINFMKR